MLRQRGGTVIGTVKLVGNTETVHNPASVNLIAAYTVVWHKSEVNTYNGLVAALEVCVSFAPWGVIRIDVHIT